MVFAIPIYDFKNKRVLIVTSVCCSFIDIRINHEFEVFSVNI